jgi:hypothetical protein
MLLMVKNSVTLTQLARSLLIILEMAFIKTVIFLEDLKVNYHYFFKIDVTS